jgi:diguanylate cyclase (GGDEF)-like protein
MTVDTWLFDQLLRSRLFQDVPMSIASAVVSGSEVRRLVAEEVLLRACQSNETMYLVMEGLVRVHVAGAERPYLRLGPGECVGELSLIDGQPASADVIADEPTVVLTIDREQLWWLVDASAEVARNLFRVLAGRVRHDDAAIGESTRVQSQLERVATVDSLTGLRNRRWLDDMFPRLLERAARTNRPASALLIDVDRFKSVNDKHGHLVGDGVLRRVAALLAAALRPQDLLARYGGEEFAVLLPDADIATAEAIAERLRQTVESAPVEQPPVPAVTVTIGIASRQPDDTVAALLGRADQALYRGKRDGRNRTAQ